MRGASGLQQFTANGTLSPVAITRIYSIDFSCAASAANISIYNSLTSTNLLLRLNTDSQGVGHYDWGMGFPIPNGKGVFVMTNTNAVTTVMVNYSTEA